MAKIGKRDKMAIKKNTMAKASAERYRSTSSAKNIDELVQNLNADPSSENWSKFSAAIKKSNARYYKIVYPRELKGMDNLAEAYAILYDIKFKILFKVPIILINKNPADKKQIKGATSFLSGLMLNRQ